MLISLSLFLSCPHWKSCLQKILILWVSLTFQKRTITSLYTITIVNWNAWYFLAPVEEPRQDIESDILNLQRSLFFIMHMV